MKTKHCCLKEENEGFQCWYEVTSVDWDPGMLCFVGFHWRFLSRGAAWSEVYLDKNIIMAAMENRFTRNKICKNRYV